MVGGRKPSFGTDVPGGTGGRRWKLCAFFLTSRFSGAIEYGLALLHQPQEPVSK